MRIYPICPKNMWQFFNPSTLCFIQPLLKPINYDLIDCFSLSIPLQIGQGWIYVPNAQLTTISPKGFTIKLKHVIRDKGTRNYKSGYNILPNKLLCINISNVGQWLSFNPLCEVISSNQKPSPVPHSPEEWSHNIQAPLSEWPWAWQRIKYSPRLVNVRSKSLALITLFYILLCLFLHTRPPIPLSKSSMW